MMNGSMNVKFMSVSVLELPEPAHESNIIPQNVINYLPAFAVTHP
jgi:hypothetical protein